MNGVSQARSQAAIAYLVSRGVAPEAAAERVASVSRQRVWQLAMRSEGRCRICGRDSGGKSRCKDHQSKHEQSKRKREVSNGIHE